MSRPRLVHIRSVAQLRADAGAWDDLWQRSPATLPTLRAELVAQWVRHFTPRADFHALVVEHQGRWVAALPLIRRKLAHLIDAGAMPLNEWSASGELLLDPDSQIDAVLDTLVAAMAGLPWQLFWLEDVAIDSPRWKAFTAAVDRAALATHFQEQTQLGRIEIDHDWPAFRERWSRRHRQQMARHSRRLSRLGSVRLRLLSRLAPDEVRTWLRRGFEVEDRSWKGPAGSSVLRTPGMFDFFARQAELLARWGQLELAFLQCSGHPIAFCYGLSAKGVFHSIKVGYDAEYAAYSPGQLLRYHLFQRLYDDPNRRAIDHMTSSEAHRKWRPSSYPLGRLVIAPRRLLARAALGAYRHSRPYLRRLRGIRNG